MRGGQSIGFYLILKRYAVGFLTVFLWLVNIKYINVFVSHIYF